MGIAKSESDTTFGNLIGQILQTIKIILVLKAKIYNPNGSRTCWLPSIIRGQLYQF